MYHSAKKTWPVEWGGGGGEERDEARMLNYAVADFPLRQFANKRDVPTPELEYEK